MTLSNGNFLPFTNGSQNEQTMEKMFSHTSRTPGCNTEKKLVDSNLFIRIHTQEARISLRKWDIPQKLGRPEGVA